MALTTPGGFIARECDASNTAGEFTSMGDMAKKVLGSLVRAIYDAGVADVAARGGSGAYWNYDPDWVSAVRASELLFWGDTNFPNAPHSSTVDGCFVDCSNGLEQPDSAPAFGTCLKGLNGERLYLAMGAGVQSGSSSTVGTSTNPLIINTKWVQCNTDGYIANSDLHIWYMNPKDTGKTFGLTPAHDDFIPDAEVNDWRRRWGWAYGGLVGYAYYAYNETSNSSIIVDYAQAHVTKWYALCKDGCLVIGLKNDRSNTTYRWVAIGKDLVQNVSNTELPTSGVGGVLPLTGYMYDGGSGYDYLTHERQGGLFLPNKNIIKLTGVIGGWTSNTSGQPRALYPIAAHAFPSDDDKLSGNYNSFVGFMRSDLLRSTCGYGLTDFTTIMDGKYIVLPLGAGDRNYDETNALTRTDLLSCQKLILGWDASNTIVF